MTNTKKHIANGDPKFGKWIKQQIGRMKLWNQKMMNNICIKNQPIYHTKMGATYAIMYTTNQREAYMIHDAFNRKRGTMGNIYQQSIHMTQ